MTYRVTQAAQYSAVAARMRENLARLQRTQLDLASGRRIRLPSDDPGGSARLLGLDRARATIARWSQNAGLALGTLEQSAEELQEAAAVLAEVREKILEGLNGTLSAADRNSLSSEVDRAVDRLMLSANASAEGRFLFAGSRIDTAPFARRLGADGVERVAYRGDALEPTLEIASGVTEKTGLPGGVVFGPAPGARRVTTYVGGGTGVRPATGLVDAARGRAAFRTLHVATSFGAPGSGAVLDAASGVALAASGAAGDTILGAGHALAVDVQAGGSGTVSLNGGPPVAFGPTDVDLAVAGPDGEVVRLNLSGATPGYSGTLTLGATGEMTGDGGATRVAIDFAAPAQSVVDSEGRAFFVDARAVRKAAEERVTFGGTVDPFDALLAVRDLFRFVGTDDETAAALDEARGFLDEVDAARDRLLSGLADVAGGAERAEATQFRLDDLLVDADDRRSKLRDVDLPEATSRLAAEDNAYQSSLLIAARVGRVSLLDFLR